MEEQHGRPVALVEIVQAQAVLLDVVRLESRSRAGLEALVGCAVGVHPATRRATREIITVAIGETACSGNTVAMTLPPRARASRHPPMRVVPPEDETIVADDWPIRPEGQVVVEQTVAEVVPRRRMPVIWPWLLGLLLLVLGGLGAYYVVSQDDDDDAAATTTTAPTTTAPTTTATTAQATAPVSVPDVVGTTSSEATAALREAGLEANLVSVPSRQPAGSVVAQSPAAGEQAPEGSTVRLNVAQQPTETTPPPATTGPVASTPTTDDHAAAGQSRPVPDAVGSSLMARARLRR